VKSIPKAAGMASVRKCKAMGPVVKSSFLIKFYRSFYCGVSVSRFFLFYFGRRFMKPLFIEKSLCLLSVALSAPRYVVFDLQNQVKPSDQTPPA
jgi:hypothetical protein